MPAEVGTGVVPAEVTADVVPNDVPADVVLSNVVAGVVPPDVAANVEVGAFVVVSPVLFAHPASPASSSAAMIVNAINLFIKSA